MVIPGHQRPCFSTPEEERKRSSRSYPLMAHHSSRHFLFCVGSWVLMHCLSAWNLCVSALHKADEMMEPEGEGRRAHEVPQRCYLILRILAPFLVAPLCITSFVFTNLFAYIYATENSYGAQDWQKCLTVPNIGNLHLDNNKYCTSASNYAGTAYLSLLVAMLGAHVGLTNNDLLPVSIYTSLVGIIGIICYRESYPYYDDPHFMSTTLLTLTHYITPTMYDNLAANSLLPEPLKAKIPSSEVCRTAFKVNLVFLCVQYGILAVALLVLALCVYAYIKTPPLRPSRPPLKASFLHPVFALTGCLAMITMLISKEIVADTAIKIARSSGHGTVYQFLDSNLDMVSLTTLLTIGAAIFGVCKRDVLPIKLCAAIGFIHMTRSLPGLLGTIAGYSGINIWDFETERERPILDIEEKYYVLWKHKQCIQYVIDTNKSSFNKDPTAYEDASTMCSAFIGSISGQIATFLSMALLVVCSVVVIIRNPEKGSDKRILRRENNGPTAPLLLNGFMFDGDEAKAPMQWDGDGDDDGSDDDGPAPLRLPQQQGLQVC